MESINMKKKIFISIWVSLAIFLLIVGSKLSYNPYIYDSPESVRNNIYPKQKLVNSADKSWKENLIIERQGGFETSFTKSPSLEKLSTNHFEKNTVHKNNKCNRNAMFVLFDNTELYEESPLNQNIELAKKSYIDPRSDIQIIEKKSQWVKVRTINPSWPPTLQGREGWINSGMIHFPEAHDDNNYCMYIDLNKWQNVSEHVTERAKEAAINILSNDGRCNRIVNGGFIGQGQRFYLTCYPNDGGKPYHYWFSLLSVSRQIGEPKRVDEMMALQNCTNELPKALLVKNLEENAGDASPDGMSLDPKIQGLSYSSYEFSWHVTITYSLHDIGQMKCYCYVGPDARAEMTFE